MPHYVTPSYVYITRGERRTFQHRWHDAAQQTYACDSCTSTCHKDEPFYMHWRAPQQERHKHLFIEPTPLLRQQLQLIDTHKVEEFLLCDERAARNTKAFIVDAGIHAIPTLLRLLYSNALRMRLSLGFYTTVQQEELLFQSTALDILHHCDINASVDVLVYLLLRKIKCYVRRCARLVDRNSFKVKRIRVQVVRCLRTGAANAANAAADGAVVLPIQYRVKHAHANDVAYPATGPQTHCLHTIVEHSESDLVLDTATLKHYYARLLQGEEPKGDAAPVCAFNLYEFQMCKSSMELFVVPFHLGNAANLNQTRSFIVVNDGYGELRDFVEITNVRRFFQHDVGDRLHACHSCNETFFQRVDFEFHRMLRCGRGFEILHLKRDFIEIYEHCLPLRCRDYNWPLYAILPS